MGLNLIILVFPYNTLSASKKMPSGNLEFRFPEDIFSPLTKVTAHTTPSKYFRVLNLYVPRSFLYVLFSMIFPSKPCVLQVFHRKYMYLTGVPALVEYNGKKLRLLRP